MKLKSQGDTISYTETYTFDVSTTMYKTNWQSKTDKYQWD